jgi:hypothetical protein
MRRLIATLVAAAASILLVLPATAAQASQIGPQITWSGLTASTTGSNTCQIAAQTVTFKVTGLPANPKGAWTVTAFGETDGTVDVTLPLGSVTRANNGATETVNVTVGSGTPSSWPQGSVLFYVQLHNPVDHVTVTGESFSQTSC